MKHTAFLLSFYLLCLAALPCMDIELVCLENHQEKTELTHEHADDSSEESDSCPPFCYCSCCGSLLVFEEISTIKKTTNLKLHSDPSYVRYLSDQSFPDAIFPPPRV